MQRKLMKRSMARIRCEQCSCPQLAPTDLGIKFVSFVSFPQLRPISVRIHLI